MPLDECWESHYASSSRCHAVLDAVMMTMACQWQMCCGDIVCRCVGLARLSLCFCLSIYSHCKSLLLLHSECYWEEDVLQSTFTANISHLWGWRYVLLLLCSCQFIIIIIIIHILISRFIKFYIMLASYIFILFLCSLLVIVSNISWWIKNKYL